MLEREMRIVKEAMSRQQETLTGKGERKMTAEELLNGIREGKALLQNGEKFTFEIRDCLLHHIPMPVIQNFYMDTMKEAEAVILANQERNVCQIITLLEEPLKIESIEEWRKKLEEGMLQAGGYAEVTEEYTLKNIDYLTFRTASAKGWIYNHIFRIRTDSRVMGIFNCMEEDKDTFGTLLEALILYMNELLSDSAGEDGKGV